MTKAEKKFLELIAKRGKQWSVSRHGWPDFLLTVKGKAIAVEVKSENDKLRSGQEVMFTALESAGLEVRVWWEKIPDRLIPWRKFKLMTTDIKQRVGGTYGMTNLRSLLEDE